MTWIVVSLLGIALGAGFVLGQLLARGFSGAERAERQLESKTLQESLTNALSLMDELRTELLKASREALDWKRRAEEYRSTNAGILNERDVWIRYSQAETAAHGNAQALMMDFINQAIRRLAREGIDILVPDILLHTQGAYSEKYLDPVLKATGSQVIHKAEDGSITAQNSVTIVGDR
jgi:hypothetical protein